MGVKSAYKKHIAEGRRIVIISVVFAVFIRLIYFFCFDLSTYKYGNESYLWNLIAPLFENNWISFLSSSICVALIAVLLAHINTKYVLIRRKTLLHIALAILLFSCHPAFIVMNPGYISALAILLVISNLFDSYGTTQKAISTLRVSSIIALASLFSPGILLYFPILWICLALMRSFNFKAFLASLFGMIVVYFPAFSFYLFTNQLNAFFTPFISIKLDNILNVPILSYNYIAWIVVGFSLILACIILINNYMTNYKDKIKIRALITSLNLIALFALILLLFLNIEPANSFYILLVSSVLPLAHFFALAQEKWIIILFYIYIIFYTAACFLTFIPIS